MVRLGTIAAGLGVVSGAWLMAALYFLMVASGSSLFGLSLAGLSAALVLTSLVALVGPRAAYLVGGVVSVAMALMVIIGSGGESLPFIVATVALLLVVAALDFFVGMRRSTLSEQSNPMNLPVFG